MVVVLVLLFGGCFLIVVGVASFRLAYHPVCEGGERKNIRCVIEELVEEG